MGTLKYDYRGRAAPNPRRENRLIKKNGKDVANIGNRKDKMVTMRFDQSKHTDIKKKAQKAKNDNNVQDNIVDFDSFDKVLIIKGCQVSLNFLPESNGETIDTVKKMLISSQYQNISGKISNANS